MQVLPHATQMPIQHKTGQTIGEDMGINEHERLSNI
jgi:hypothetical protein